MAGSYHTVSALSLGNRGWIQTTSFVGCGLLVTVAALGIHLAAGNSWLALAVAAFGLALVASGDFAMDPMRGYPPGAPRDDPDSTSRANQLHDWAGITVFSALPLAAGIAAFTLESRP